MHGCCCVAAHMTIHLQQIIVLAAAPNTHYLLPKTLPKARLLAFTVSRLLFICARLTCIESWAAGSNTEWDKCWNHNMAATVKDITRSPLGNIRDPGNVSKVWIQIRRGIVTSNSCALLTLWREYGEREQINPQKVKQCIFQIYLPEFPRMLCWHFPINVFSIPVKLFW